MIIKEKQREQEVITLHNKKVNKKKVLDLLKFRALILLLIISFLFYLIFDKYNYEHRFHFLGNLNFDTLLDLNKNKTKFDDNFYNSQRYKDIKKELDEKIVANSYIVYDVKTSKVIFEKNSTTSLPLASVSKLMTAYVSVKYCNDKLKNRLEKLLVMSSNEDADYIANNCPNYDEFVSNMNKESVKNNLNMTYINPSGLDIDNETKASNYGDAYSVSKLLVLLNNLDKVYINMTSNSYVNGFENTNHFASYWPFLKVSKTGFTDVAGGNLATTYEPSPGNLVNIVVLGSTKEDRFSDNYFLFKKYLEIIN